ncbi:TetR/AcrR family transcriptional regulator [Myxacorys almedinensis]|uniref:TetR family transcriptional regulator n=1 Tax=Myxacorys almedinensis A TaxID=2690445 RepID=A0A8J8CML6_9CYAN|nr:TetR/AcrR family transcriptional regulator [Myxacorys almedinensis]NDJ18815.1 TetR family transcriptional regulator [Myxacorys almedinensis A]
MSTPRNPTRQRLIDAALELFAHQGVTDTTTKQIAELAEVNEVTLFRQFGNKHGLLLAVIKEAAVFTHIGQTLVQQANQTSSLDEALKEYANASLQALERVPEMVRSVVGEAGQYPAENREALGRGFTQANRYVAEYFETVIDRGQLHTHLPADKLASLLNGMLLGYAVIEFTSEFHDLWQNREDFLDNLVTLFLQGAVSNQPTYHSQPIPALVVSDLPASIVHAILQRAKKESLQDYALMYVLFGSGLSSTEAVALERSHYFSDRTQQFLQVAIDTPRQVPLNQWIMGKRYGSYLKNPLIQWLKSRKDAYPALFLNGDSHPLTEVDLQQQWQRLTSGFTTPEGQRLTIEQAQQTWCVDLFLRGMTIEQMQILTGWKASQLEPYAQRSREKAALEHAIRLDQKS